MDTTLKGLKEVDRIEITTLMDNYVDVLLGNNETATRPPLSYTDSIPTDTLTAEHGLSLLITVSQDQEIHTILLDTGYSKTGLIHNMELLRIDPGSIETIVISHAHMDHNGALYTLLDVMPEKPALVVHPFAFHHPRFLMLKDGNRLEFPRVLIREELERQNVNLIINETPSMIAGNMISVTGSVERSTDFEKGMPNAFMELDGRIEHDPIMDDQALLINLRNKGLVVITGCSHSGIVNTLRFAQKITGLESIYGIFGGFHLTGQISEEVLENSLDEIGKLTPRVIVPMHCTGWDSIKRIEQKFPHAFILNSVGTKYILKK